MYQIQIALFRVPKALVYLKRIRLRLHRVLKPTIEEHVTLCFEIAWLVSTVTCSSSVAKGRDRGNILTKTRKY